MNERTIPTASTLTGAMSRRGTLRILAGLAMASSGLSALEGTDADARNKKDKRKNKGRKGSKGICADKRHARVRVPHDGSVVYTAKLEAGKHYRLRASGYASGYGPLLPSVGVDAAFIFRPDGDPSLARDVYAGIDFGLSVDGAPANWGAHQPDHVYTREVVGEGKKLALRMVTKAEESLTPNNQSQPSTRREIEINPLLTLSGSLTVEILCD
jgi:hypothetical protein